MTRTLVCRLASFALRLALVTPLTAGVAFASTPSPFGAWYMPLSPGSPVINFFEVREDGTCLTYKPESAQDRAECSVEPSGVLRIRSLLTPGLGGDIPYHFEGDDHLVLMIGLVRQDWTRVAWKPFFEVRNVDGQAVPANLGLLVRGTIGTLQDWRPDVVPAWLNVQMMRNQEMRVTLDTFSPSDGAAMRITFTRWAIDSVQTYQSPAGRTAKLPPAFLDLPRIAGIGHQQGERGFLSRAEIGLTTGNWSVSFAAENHGLTLDAETGERTRNENEEAYIAGYNAQWNSAMAGLRARFAAERSHRGVSLEPWPSFSDGGAGSDGGESGNPIEGEADFGVGPQNAWDAGDDGAYDRYEQGIPTGDDCNNYGGC